MTDGHGKAFTHTHRLTHTLPPTFLLGAINSVQQSGVAYNYVCASLCHFVDFESTAQLLYEAALIGTAVLEAKCYWSAC